MAESGKSSDPFFPSIRDAAQHTDDLVDDESRVDPDDKAGDDIPPMQEVESLCMTCGEQVRRDQRAQVCCELKTTTGKDATPPYIYTLFQRSHHHVIPLRALWHTQ